MNTSEKTWGFIGAILVVSILIFAMSYSLMAGLLMVLALVAVLTWKPKKIEADESKSVSNAEIEKELEDEMP